LCLSTALAQPLPADATRQLYERHSSRIFGFCLSRLGSREEAEDALQTTFLNAQRGLGRGVVPEYELAWLFKIAQNVCHNRHQSARRRGRVEAAHDLEALQDVIASPDRSATVSLGELTRALGAIPTRQRRALLLREFEGHSYEEIASELGISVAAVETLLFRARRAVAQQLEQSGVTSGSRRSAAATAVELFRWFFGGAAAPLKLAAVTAAVATTAALSVVTDHKPAPVAPPVIVKHSAVVPASKVRPRSITRTTVRPITVRATSQQSAGNTLPAPIAEAGRTQSTTGSTTVKPTSAAVAPIVLAPDLPAPVTLPTVTVPGITVPTVTLPTVVVPEVQLPATPDLPKLP
jgi:RNA polymerase sigma factor (sigma-70 family)